MGNKKSKDIELEEETYEIDLKTAGEMQSEEGATEIESLYDKTKDVTVEPVENLEESEEEATEEIELIKNIDIKEEDSKEKDKIEDIAQEIAQESKTEESIPTLIKESENSSSDDLALQETIAKIAQIETEDTVEKSKVIEPEEKTTALESDKVDQKDNKVLYKLIGLKVDKLDFEANAHKLNIDIDSYKMLLSNYLDEIEKYRADLENGSSSTIDMLTDAGELLSVDILAQELKKLKNRDDKSESLKEISLISSLIKEKIESKESSDKEEKELASASKVERKEPIKEKRVETKEIAIPPIPDEVIDITSAENLLSVINAKSVNFNPNRASEELNLPRGLILDFVNDFILQSKEHLPVMVEAFKNNDLNKLQTTAHMLKGAASNLRLDSLAETLFKIQKSNDINSSEELIKSFVAKIKGLEQEVASLEDADNEN